MPFYFINNSRSNSLLKSRIIAGMISFFQTDKKKPGANPEPKPPNKQSKHRDD